MSHADEVVIFSSLNSAVAHLVRSALTHEGIPSTLRRQHLAPLMGEVPADDARAEVAVAPADVERALEVVRAAQTADLPDRDCPTCGEGNPGSFEICWSCGADLPPPTLRVV